MKLLNIAKKIFGRAEYLDVIADSFSNLDIPDSFSGGSLADSNILIVTNKELPSIINEVFSTEKTYYSVKKISGFLNVEDITNASEDLIGPFTHIINVFFDEKEGSLLLNNQFNDSDSVYQLYQWHQEEVDYLVKLNHYSTICTLFICDTSTEGNVKRKNVEMCIRGLAEALSNHYIICNGIIARCDTAIKKLLQSAAFLSSRYGQVMTGEILKLDQLV